MMSLIATMAAFAAFVFIAVLAYVFAPPGDQVDEETEWWIFGWLLFGGMDGEE